MTSRIQNQTKNQNSTSSILDVLYEEPGQKTKKRIRFFTAISIALAVLILALIVRQFYVSGQLSARYWSFFAKFTTWRFLFSGLIGTVKVSLTGILLSFLIGFVLMFLRVRGGKISRFVSVCLIEFFRGVPTLLFIYFFFIAVPMMGIKIQAFWKITFPVALSACGSVAEVLRDGINSVGSGQREAALSLGFSENRTFFKILFPQGLKFVVPALISQFVIILKDTTFAYIVSYNDLMQDAMVLISNHDAMLSVYLVVAVIYIIINYLLNLLSVSLAKKIGRKNAK